jgi:hypothetical protein
MDLDRLISARQWWISANKLRREEQTMERMAAAPITGR